MRRAEHLASQAGVDVSDLASAMDARHPHIARAILIGRALEARDMAASLVRVPDRPEPGMSRGMVLDVLARERRVWVNSDDAALYLGVTARSLRYIAIALKRGEACSSRLKIRPYTITPSVRWLVADIRAELCGVSSRG